MAFSMGSALQGAGSLAALGPVGAGVGGLLGGFLGGGDEPEEYGADAYAKDMAPYKAMIDKQVSLSESLMNPNSIQNRTGASMLMNKSLDQMGTANIMAGRNNAQAGGNSGLLQAVMNQNVSNYANQGLQQQNQFYQQRYGQGLNLYNTAVGHQGDYSSGLANLNAANVGAANEASAASSGNMLGGLGTLAGTIAGFGGEGASLKDSATAWLGFGTGGKDKS